MEPHVFERYRQLIYRKSGIVLSPEKKSLLASRIQKRIRAHGLSSEAEYLNVIETDATAAELVHLIDAISTNTTYFWREPEHFQLLGQILKDWRAQGRNKVRIWCAAASTGQEPYTLAMEALENMQGPKFDVKILATDVSTKVLKIAREGIYDEPDVAKLPSTKQSRFFTKLPLASDRLESQCQVSQELANLILFKQLNLIEFPYPIKTSLDIIFCRNVMIYFDVKTRQQIVDECARLLAPGGLLFLSLSESLLGITHNLQKYGTSVYQKRV